MINKKNFRRDLQGWFRLNARDLPWRRTSDPYAIWLSEVMLQQTQVRTVLPYYREFLKKFPALEVLAAADLQTVLKVWEGLGYYARARNLHRAAGLILADREGQFPKTYAEIHRLPGIGDYTAAAIASIAFGLPYAVVDGNVKRILCRLLEIEAPVNDPALAVVFREAADGLLDLHYPGRHNQAMMELGALLCRSHKPLCQECPVHAHCRAFTHDTTGDFPRRVQKKPIPEYHIAVGVVRKRGRLLITRRQAEGLLGGLWEFPGGKRNDDESPARACLREIREETGLTVKIDAHLMQVRHAYTHFRIVMEVYLCTYLEGRVRLNGPETHRWITPAGLDRYPFPGANRKFIPRLLEVLLSG